jgi:hypothetical protein
MRNRKVISVIVPYKATQSHNSLDPKSAEGKIRFLSYELKSTMSKLGSKLGRAKTVEDAAKAIEPYWTMLRREEA